MTTELRILNNTENGVEGRLLAGMSRIALVLRHRGWADATEYGITPTQGQILSLIATRKAQGFGVSDIASELALTKPTVSDSISAMVRKGLIEKSRSSEDARAVNLRLTEKGERLAASTSLWPDFLLAATRQMDDQEKAVFLRGLIKMVRSLQEHGLIPISRMCVNCSFFRPRVYSEFDKPHHCEFYGAPFGDLELQIDCKDHVVADEKQRSEAWSGFIGGRA